MTRQDSSLSLDKNTGESMAAKLSSKKTTKKQRTMIANLLIRRLGSYYAL